MASLYNYVESAIINYKLEYCCWALPLRIGIYILGYLNLGSAFICTLGIANESFSPTIMKVQETILDEDVSKPFCLLAYSTEMCFTVILLFGLYRNDRAMLQLYMYYSIAMVISSILVYSIVINAVDVLIIISIVFNILLQLYILILVWSVNVGLRNESQKNGNVQITYNAADQDVKITTDPEAPVETNVTPLPEEHEERKETNEHGENGEHGDNREHGDKEHGKHKEHKVHHETKLETVNEDPKEN